MTHRRTSTGALAALAAVVALGACGGGGAGAGENDDGAKGPPKGGDRPLSGEAPVKIAHFEFKPKTIKITPGTKVTWTNADSSIHDIKDTSPLASPPSPEMSKSDTFSITYAQPGSYSYVCGIHPYMMGTVEVVP